MISINKTHTKKNYDCAKIYDYIFGFDIMEVIYMSVFSSNFQLIYTIVIGLRMKKKSVFVLYKNYWECIV